MRLGLTISCCAHVAVLAMAVVGFHSTKPFEITPEVALPVDLVSVEEFTNMTAGLKSGEIKDTPQAPQAPEERNAAPQPEPKPEPKPEPAPQPAAAPEPEPAPAPEPEQAKAEPEPAPEPEPKPEAKPEEPKYVQLPRKLEMPKRAPKPRREEPRPTPITAQAQQDQKQFDPNSIAALLDKQERPPEAGGVTQQPLDGAPSLGAPSGTAVRLSMSEIDYLRQQISRCWSPPIGVLDAVGLVVKLDVELAPDGALVRPPIVANTSSDPIFTIASEAAARAVVQCQPYSLPADKYDAWKHMIVNFDPREMAGG